MKGFREKLGLIVILVSIIVIGIVGYKIVEGGKTADFQYVYSSLLPLVGTWVGVVLAFYFGKENYEVASKQYEKIIDKLSPEVLDDVKISQIMISKKTMVSKKWKDIKDNSVREITDFLIGIDKSRLPILSDDGKKVKYIIHSSLLLKPIKDVDGKITEIDYSQKMSAFVEKVKGIVDLVSYVQEEEIVENARKLMNENPGSKDIFVTNKEGDLVGWLTDTLVLRYINTKKI